MPAHADTNAAVPYATIRRTLDRQPLFEDKSWRLSPNPWPLSNAQLEELQAIGTACLHFHRALDQLYLRSASGRNLLRNRTLQAPWVAAYLDRGKPARLVEHARSRRLRGAIPTIIRPDLLLTDDGFALTEIDSVPGGIGLTAFLNRLYQTQHPQVIGAGDRMVDAFYHSLASLAPHCQRPVVAILVSDEAATYRPEMEWLAEVLQERGFPVYCRHPQEVIPLARKVCLDINGSPEQVDVIYRFWELFDLANVAVADFILEAWEDSELVVSPPMRAFQEEKLNLALFHHHLLEDFWKENLPRESLCLLRRIIPKSWIMDPVDLPPNAVLDAPAVGGKPIWKWDQLADASQRERNLIIKLSGFHENAWGARSVIFGADASRTEWTYGIREACRLADQNLCILQEYRKPRRLSHPVYAPTTHGSSDATPVRTMEGRLRLCPYYFVSEGVADLGGVLATFCPADKKIIHGMKDAALLPCALSDPMACGLPPD